MGFSFIVRQEILDFAPAFPIVPLVETLFTVNQVRGRTDNRRCCTMSRVNLPALVTVVRLIFLLATAGYCRCTGPDNNYGDPVTGCFFYDTSFYKYQHAYPALFDKVTAMGIDELYLSVNAQTLEGADTPLLRNFLTEADNHRVRVYALHLQKRGLVDSTSVAAAARQLLSFQNSAATVHKFAGMVIDIEPYAASPWDWQHGWGTGGINDSLMHGLVALKRQIRNAVPAASVPEFFACDAHWYYDKKLTDSLTVGAPADFLPYSNVLIYMAYQDNQAAIASTVDRELNDAAADTCIVVAVSVADTALYGDKSLFGKTWLELAEITDGLEEEFSAYRSFRGICFFEFASLEEAYDRSPPSELGPFE